MKSKERITEKNLSDKRERCCDIHKTVPMSIGAVFYCVH